jgi:CRISPR-associated endonuclease Cas2
MICWVMYDIKNDRSRTKIAKACEQAGLYRVQYLQNSACLLRLVDRR